MKQETPCTSQNLPYDTPFQIFPCFSNPWRLFCVAGRRRAGQERYRELSHTITSEKLCHRYISAITKNTRAPTERIVQYLKVQSEMSFLGGCNAHPSLGDRITEIHTTESTTALPQPHSCRYNWLLELLAHTLSPLTISLRIEIGCFPRSVNDDFEGPCTLGGAAR